LPLYGSHEMLEALTEFILGMREQYLQADGKAVVVTHDWGAIIGARLAAEASELADQWIITSAMIVRCQRSYRFRYANKNTAPFSTFERHHARDAG
jgi:pimeloyl-ACP methyl ester carboxylesterase